MPKIDDMTPEQQDASDLETCSWCTREVPFHTLSEAHDGALICLECIQQHLRDTNLPCAGCNARWEGPLKDCMDHEENCSYTTLDDRGVI